jgi:uncharacterized damage-inducible protein DinB
MAQAPPAQDLRYPIGAFQYVGGNPDETQREHWIEAIAAAPTSLRKAVAGLSEDQIETPYRPGGWTVRQVVHHVPDSHLNAYVRMKLAMTEDQPTIRPYEEARWAELPDARTGPIEVSLNLLDSLHLRWVLFLRQLTPTQFQRRFVHPEHGRQIEVEEALALYAWHGQHHTAHIESLRRRMGWS